MSGGRREAGMLWGVGGRSLEDRGGVIAWGPPVSGRPGSALAESSTAVFKVNFDPRGSHPPETCWGQGRDGQGQAALGLPHPTYPREE